MKDRLYGLDGMRGIAAILVVAFHIGQRTAGHEWIAPGGYLAVDFFFLLSGFVIAQAYEQRLLAGLSLRDFAVIRLVRLYPLILLGVALGCIKPALQIVLGQVHAPAGSDLLIWIVTNCLILPAPNDPFLFPLNPPAWSLFFEIAINLAFAAFLFRWQRRLLALVVVASATVIIYAGLTQHSLSAGWGWANAYIGLARTGFSFVFGVVLYRFRIGRTRARSWLGFILASVVLVGILTIHVDSVMRGWFDLISVMLIFPALVLVAAATEPPPLLQKACALSGDISYPIYAIHYPLMILYVIGAKRLEGQPMLFGLIFILVMVVAAMLVLRYYDAPLRKWISRGIGKRESAIPESTLSGVEVTSR